MSFHANTSATASNAVTCALRGIAAVDPRAIVVEALENLAISSNVQVVSVGKAAVTMALGAVDVLHDQIVRGVVIAPTHTEELPTNFVTYVGGHPIPNSEGMNGARDVLSLATSLGSEDTVLCLISGGASALSMFPPNGIELSDVQSMTSLLLRAGATIDELNCVRKHIDQLKGGRLARAAAPARVITLILSDVIGDPVDVIASGPTVPDPTTFADARKVLVDRNVWNKLSDSVRSHFESAHDESPKPGDECFVRVSADVIGNNTKAAQAAVDCAELLGYRAAIVTTTLMGEARERGAEIATHAMAVQKTLSPDDAPRCFVYAGETTVSVVGSGRGGRNQEFVLAAAVELEGSKGITIVSLGTDGIDGPTDAAGAVADGQTVSRAGAVRQNPDISLQNNDAYTFWEAEGGLVVLGPTGTNVMDIAVITIEPSK